MFAKQSPQYFSLAVQIKWLVSIWNARLGWNGLTIGSIFRSSHRRCSVKKVFLRFLRNSLEITCVRVSFSIKFKKETLAHIFSCEFCETFKGTFLTEHVRATASVSSQIWVAKGNMDGKYPTIIWGSTSSKDPFHKKISLWRKYHLGYLTASVDHEI